MEWRDAVNAREIDAVTASLSRAIVSGETQPGGSEASLTGSDMLRGLHPELAVPEELEPFSLLLGMVAGGGTMRALAQMED